MITATIILDSRRKTLNGYPVKIRVLERGKPHKYISLNIYQNEPELKMTPELKERDFRLIRELKFINDNKLNLEEALQIIANVVTDDSELEILMLKRKISELQGEGGIGLIEFFNARINEKQKMKESVRAYESAKKAVELYLYPKKDIAINQVNSEWLGGFKRSMMMQGVGNGLNTYLRTMRAVYKEAQKRESLNVKKDNPFLGLIMNVHRNISPDLMPEDVKKLFEYEPHKSTSFQNRYITQRNIDIFLFQFAIGGHYLSDIGSLKWKNIRRGRIVFQRFKNRRKPNGGAVIDNYLSEFALSVIDKYGNKETERIFSFIPDPQDEFVYGEYRNRVTRSLRTVSKKLGLYENLTTRTPRYLFGTFAGTITFANDNVIKQIQGHSQAEVTFRYRRSIPYEVQDAEHKKVLDLVWG